ncbi:MULTISPECIES: DUF3859 domain-containing protein [unclassified Marinimicrobium]|jgi:hypothetical protein|uniref:DUF3859 domain-containing protein n=1 Tax=unclassified Marinimicrobium TaxID=2632100 RepID=UPI000C4B2AFB|nr:MULTISPECIES: DUF3859 domain-containing protein [unclassified Marinimicrobium]MAN50564.1 hypothetical protein [Marinimicrobium sp.]|tara:strand:- start:16 stop:405 length:390 start_codon:yes stop_codon:yes gene_type:complete
MAKKKPEVKLRSWGVYTPLDPNSKELPQLIKMTRDIPCELDIEFGYIVNIKKAKNRKLQYCIYHPNIPDEDGNPLPPFDGEVYIKQNDWDFFIGDTIWKPVENKQGPWRITLAIDGQLIADETLTLMLP